MREKAAEGRGLYCPEFEHDACGIGAVVDIQGRASHETVDDALKIVEKLEHRAGKDAEGKTGDGVGILTQIPHAFFARAAAEASIALPGRRDYGVGMFFLPRDGLKRRQAQRQFELVTEKAWLSWAGGRCPCTRRFWASEPGTKCLASSRLLWPGRRKRLPAWILTESSM